MIHAGETITALGFNAPWRCDCYSTAFNMGFAAPSGETVTSLSSAWDLMLHAFIIIIKQSSGMIETHKHFSR